MKKIILVISIGFLPFFCFSQDAKVASAFNYVKSGELDKAKSDIDAAIENSETLYKSKTWFVRSLVYHSIYESTNPLFQKLCENPLDIAYEAYIKTIDYDKTKEFQADITKRMNVLSNQYSNKGVKEFNEFKYDKALASFENSLAIQSMPMFLRTDTNTVFNAAMAAYSAKKYNKALEYYLKLADYKYGGADVFYYISDIYSTNQQNDKSIEYLKKGIERYPADVKLSNQLVNIYISNNNNEEAKNLLENLISKGIKNADYYYILAGLYDYTTDFEKVKNLYEKSIEVNPKHPYAYYRLGLIHYNMAVKENDRINSITDDIQYKAAKAKVEDYFKQSLPYFEKNIEINPSDTNTLKSLKFLYKRYNQTEKYNQICKRLGEN